MDAIAFCLLPPPRPIGVKIAGHDVTLIEVALAGYTLVIGVGLWLWFGTWLWFLATVASMILAAIMLEWML